MPYDIILIVELRNRQKSNKCECAGIGRQARLRGVCFTTYGFKSRHSHRAEILGIRKSELIDLYDKLGYSYFDMTMDDLDDELNTFRELKKKEAAV